MLPIPIRTFLPLLKFPILVWKVKTAGVFFPCIIKPLGCYQAWNRHVSIWYINTFSPLRYRSTQMGEHLTEVSLSRLPYLPQTVCKEQRSKKEREGHRETQREREGGRVRNSHRSKSHRTVGRARFTVLQGSYKAHSWRTHLDRENQSWLPLSSDLKIHAQCCSLTISRFNTKWHLACINSCLIHIFISDTFFKAKHKDWSCWVFFFT